jgi:hypothetical protein
MRVWLMFGGTAMELGFLRFLTPLPRAGSVRYAEAGAGVVQW